MTENELSKKRLQWQCRRGMLELDVLLGRFLEDCYEQLNIQQKQDFVALLRVNDPQIYSWLMQQQATVPEFQAIITIIKNWQNNSG